MSPRPLPGPRLRRVLALLPWLADHPGASIAELATRFSVSESELERDLELLPMCGLPPYTPDRLIDVEIVDGHVWIRFAEYFDRPLRLGADEGLALLAAGRALLAVPGSDTDGPLATALEKLERAVGAREGGLAVEVGEPEHLEAIRAAADDHEQVEIEYYSFGRDVLTTRRIDPHAVFHGFGHWYVDAWCHLAHGERRFRLDRVQAVRSTGEHFDPPGSVPTGAGGVVYDPDPDDPRVTLELAPSAAWVVESYPAEQVDEQPDGRLRVVMAVSEPTWLERLLLRLGPDAVVLDPPDYRGLGSAAAQRLLGRYQGG